MKLLIRSIPMALSTTERVCSSVNVGSTKTAVSTWMLSRLMGEIVKETAEYTKEAGFPGLCKAGGILQCAG